MEVTAELGRASSETVECSYSAGPLVTPSPSSSLRGTDRRRGQAGRERAVEQAFRRKDDARGRALAEGAFDLQTAAVQRDQLAGQRQTKAGPVEGLGKAVVQ